MLKFKEKTNMKRREFLSGGARIAAGAALMLNGSRFTAARNAEPPHPLYFDGLTFFGARKGDLAKSGLSGLIWDVSTGDIVDGKFIRSLVPTLKSIGRANRLLKDNQDGLFLATRGKNGRIAVFLQFQSLESISEDLEMMDVFYELGLRICQFNHHYSNAFAGGSLVPNLTGLTKLGFEAIEKMNLLNIIPDLSHANDVLTRDVLSVSKKPVVMTHTGCRSLVRNARCATDSMIKGVADSGGVVGIFSMSFWLTEDPVPTVDSYIKQLEHVIKVGGIDAVGISNDYDIAGQLSAAKLNNNNAEAVKSYFPWWKQHQGILGFDKLPQHIVIPELNNIRRFFTLQTALEKRGYKTADVEKILGGNWARILTECLG
jgi:membrane dipeptidase